MVGHVDAGKSTLFGRLLYDLGSIDERSMQKLRKESEKLQKSSFAFAWALDSSTEERERGVTIDIATSTFETSTRTFTILDAPGHKDFVPNMIAGASQADFAVLVIDASRGAFESGFDAKGQTKEHAILIRALGIQRIIVAVNKLDNIEWAESRYKDICTQLGTFMTMIGFEASSVSYVPCSGLSGENITTPVKESKLSWYKGRCLLAEMQSIAPAIKDAAQSFRMLVSDIQATPNSTNLSISGKISAGEVQVNDTVLCMPSRALATVKMITSNSTDDIAFAGDIVTLVLANVEESDLRIGDVLCHTSDVPENATSFEARLVTFQMSRPLLAGSTVVLHRGRSDVSAIIRELQTADKKTPGTFKKARHILGNSQGLVKIDLIRGVLPLDAFAKNKDLGRVIIRREGETIAAGIVSSIIS